MQTVNWRGITTDVESALMFEAAATDPELADIKVRPIPGCGSFQTSTENSANTHAGSGAVDIDCEGLTDEQAKRMERVYRRYGGTAYFRPRSWYSPFYQKTITPGWQRHLHVLRSYAYGLSPEAVAQVREYEMGFNGLKGDDVDTGDRRYVYVNWLDVKETLEGNMPTVDEVWAKPLGNNPADGKTPSNAGNALEIARNYTYYNYLMLRNLSEKLGAPIVVDVNEAEIAAALLPALSTQLVSVLTEAIEQMPSATAAEIAQATMDALAQRLAS